MPASWKEAPAVPSLTCRNSVCEIHEMGRRHVWICRCWTGPHRASQHHSLDEGGLSGLTRPLVLVHHSKVTVVSSFNILTMGISAKDEFGALSVFFLMWKRFENILFEVMTSTSNEVSIPRVYLLSHMGQINFGFFLCQNLRGRNAEVKLFLG